MNLTLIEYQLFTYILKSQIIFDAPLLGAFPKNTFYDSLDFAEQQKLFDNLTKLGLVNLIKTSETSNMLSEQRDYLYQQFGYVPPLIGFYELAKKGMATWWVIASEADKREMRDLMKSIEDSRDTQVLVVAEGSLFSQDTHLLYSEDETFDTVDLKLDVFSGFIENLNFDEEEETDDE
jgi:hypothetical protein